MLTFPLMHTCSFWLGVLAVDRYQEMQKQRQGLPAYTRADSLVETVQSHQVTVICGATGCGKSTQVRKASLEFPLTVQLISFA